MHALYYQSPGTWFGDCMPFFHDGQFYLYHQRDTRRPGPFGEPFGWALARTRDFVDYEDLGESLHRGGDDEQDQFIFAGSVFAADGVPGAGSAPSAAAVPHRPAASSTRCTPDSTGTTPSSAGRRRS